MIARKYRWKFKIPPANKTILAGIEKQPLPKGRISIRWVQSRAVYQLYIGGRYAAGCSGNTPEEAQEQLAVFYTWTDPLVVNTQV